MGSVGLMAFAGICWWLIRAARRHSRLAAPAAVWLLSLVFCVDDSTTASAVIRIAIWTSWIVKWRKKVTIDGGRDLRAEALRSISSARATAPEPEKVGAGLRGAIQCGLHTTRVSANALVREMPKPPTRSTAIARCFASTAIMRFPLAIRSIPERESLIKLNAPVQSTIRWRCGSVRNQAQVVRSPLCCDAARQSSLRAWASCKRARFVLIQSLARYAPHVLWPSVRSIASRCVSPNSVGSRRRILGGQVAARKF